MTSTRPVPPPRVAHLRQIMRKLGVTNRTQVALAARRLGISATVENTLARIALDPDVAPASAQLV